MFGSDVPTYLIDLGNPGAKRWDEVIAREKTVARRLVQEAGAEFARTGEVMVWRRTQAQAPGQE